MLPRLPLSFSGPRPQATAARRVFATAALACIVSATAFAGYQRLFCSFAMYDDEGYVMVSLKQFMDGGALYDEVYSQYGPAYYWVSRVIHGFTKLPVSHEVTRFKTLFVWMCVALLSAGWLHRVTGNRLLAAVGFLLTSLHLERLAMEPGHPQELCVLSVAVCLFLGSFVQKTRSNVPVCSALAIATALCLMTKVNVGVFLLLSISAALLFATARGRTRNLLLAAVIGSMILLPVIIARHHVLDWQGYRLPTLLVAAVSLTAWMCSRANLPALLRIHDTFVFWGACAGTMMVFAGITVWSGTSWSGLIHGLVTQHVGFVDAHYHAPPIYALAPLAAVAAVAAARSTLRSEETIRWIRLAVIVLVVGAALRHVVETFQPLYHGSQDRGQAGLLVSYFVSLVWIILLPLHAGNDQHAMSHERAFARMLLCLIASLQPLIAYPVPGTQMAIGSLGLVVALLTALHDALATRRAARRRRSDSPHRLLQALAACLMTAVLLRGAYLYRERSRMPALNLAGTGALRLPEQLVAREQWTVDQLHQRADTFVCLPSGHNSLYLWSGIDPPTGFNATVWQDLFPDDLQRKIVADLKNRDRVCVVFESDEPDSPNDHGPLRRYLESDFIPVARRDTTEIWQKASSSAIRLTVRNN